MSEVWVGPEQSTAQATEVEDEDELHAEPSRLAAALEGAVAGVAATLVMSGAMLAFERAGWLGEPPPRRIVRVGLARAGMRPDSERGLDLLALGAHLAFGASAGALHGALVPRALSGPATGTALGLAVWAASYAGWIPALGLLPPPRRDRPGRPAAMVVAHVVYGGVLGAVARALR